MFTDFFFTKDLLVNSNRACRAQALQKEMISLQISEQQVHLFTPNMVETNFPNLMRFYDTKKRLFMF